MTAPTPLRTFTARYHGRCAAECGELVEPGQQVGYLVEPTADSSGDVAHESCLTDAPEPPATTRQASAAQGNLCTGCFMVKPVTNICDTCG